MSWRDSRLGDVLTLQRGHDLPSTTRLEGDIPVVSSSGITGYHNESKASAPGVVTGRYGTIGEVFYIEQDYWPLNTALYVTDFKGNSPRFIAYLLRNILRNYKSDKAAVPGVNRNVLHEIKVHFPDTHVQDRIASILSAYDDLIENNRRRIQLLEQAARLLYKEWFVHLRFPGHEHVHVQIKDGLPDGWGEKPFSDVVDFKEGPGLRNHQYRDQGIPFLNIRTFNDDEIDLSKTKCIDETEVTSKYQHFLLSEDDHVVSSSGTLGRVVTIRKYHLPVMLNTSLIRMRPKGVMRKWYLKTYLKYGDFIDQATAMATGAAQLNFGPSHLTAMSVLMPDARLIELFEEHVCASYSQIKLLLDSNFQLTKSRDLLLPRLMSGEVAV